MELPMFPLGTVLFPGAVIPLHVFEPRYRALTGWCLEHDSRLGVVLIERGSEVGGGDARFAVGTQGRIVESVALPDGRWVLAVAGERRIRVHAWLGEEPFPRAEVAYLDDEPAPSQDVVVRDGIEQRARRALMLKADLGEWPPDAVAPQLDADPTVAGWQVGGLGLLGPADGQRLLEADPVGERLVLLASLLDDAIELLALRATGR